MEAVVASLAVLAAGILLAFCIKRFSLGDSVTFLALMLLPLLTYGVASGMVQEFTAPGGWGAKFREVADNPVRPAPLAKLSFEGELVAKGGADYLKEVTAQLTPGKPLALTLQLGRSGYYDPRAIAEYIRVMSTADPAVAVVVVDADGRYIASARGSAVAQQVPSPEFANALMSAIESGSAEAVLALPGFSHQAVADTASNVQALEKMDTDDVDRLVALDGDGRPEGLVLRDQIVSQLLIGLASAQP